MRKPHNIAMTRLGRATCKHSRRGVRKEVALACLAGRFTDRSVR